MDGFLVYATHRRREVFGAPTYYPQYVPNPFADCCLSCAHSGCAYCGREKADERCPITPWICECDDCVQAKQSLRVRGYSAMFCVAAFLGRLLARARGRIERRYAPGGVGFEAARLEFKSLARGESARRLR